MTKKPGEGYNKVLNLFLTGRRRDTELDEAIEKYAGSSLNKITNPPKKSKIDFNIKIFLLGIAVIVLMGIFPPWKYTVHGGGYISEKSAGYFLITSPPEPEHTHAARGVKIDTTRLFIQLVIVSLVFGGGHLWLRERRKTKEIANAGLVR